MSDNKALSHWCYMQPQQAADEIERLRAERDDLSVLVGKLNGAKPLQDLMKINNDLLAERDALRSLVETMRKALEEVSSIPHMPFPDPTAHSWHATGLALHKAWFEIQQIVGRALSSALSSDKS